MKKQYKPIWGIFPTLWYCMECGVVIWEKDIHDTVECRNNARTMERDGG